jgi:hypothetical protein
MNNNSGNTREHNELNELEAQLGSWTLRRPSPKIEKRLFGWGRAAVPAGTVVPFAWFAPVTAALLLACIIFNQHAGTAAARATNAPLVAMIISNSSAAAYLPGSFQHDQNIITANTFEWTNGSRATSSIRSPSGPKDKTFQ